MTEAWDARQAVLDAAVEERGSEFDQLLDTFARVVQKNSQVMALRQAAGEHERQTFNPEDPTAAWLRARAGRISMDAGKE